MSKVSNKKAALSHAIAYTIEAYEDTGRDFDEIESDIDKITNIKDLVAYAQSKQLFRFDEVNPIKGFYDAMLKVVPHLEYPEHGGTECRGWYRVWADINNVKSYYCKFDMGRDNAMAYGFLTHGAITQEQYNTYKTKTTLRLALNAVDANGNIDIDKITEYYAKEWISRVFNLGLLYSLEQAQDGHNATMGNLKYA